MIHEHFFLLKKDQVWIGIDDLSQEGQLKYNADQNNIQWSNWQPLISSQNTDEKDCATMIKGDWIVEDCQSQVFKFICAEKHRTVQWNVWQEWSSCSKTCGGGYETRIRSVQLPGTIIPFGQECEGQEDRECNTQPCPSK